MLKDPQPGLKKNISDNDLLKNYLLLGGGGLAGGGGLKLDVGGLLSGRPCGWLPWGGRLDGGGGFEPLRILKLLR
jgi:hypothetical protein